MVKDKKAKPKKSPAIQTSTKDLRSLVGKVVLVTGGTGTFGNAFVKRVLADNQVKKLIVFSRDEYKQHIMRGHVQDPHGKLRFFIGDIRDKARLLQAFKGVDVVVHAAALKQVPAMEYNPTEAVKTNIDGSQNVFDAALENNVDKVVFISSDKAVLPINLYGATKFTGEKLCVAMNAYRGEKHDTKFSAVRYGNVIGSRGSFIELIEKQESTGEITLTHRDMTRFWIPIDQVISMVLNTIEVMRGGEVFIPKMKNLPIVDVIALLAPTCTIREIGMRPGEKMHEVLITQHESPRTYDIGFAYAVKPEYHFHGVEAGWLDRMPKVDTVFEFSSNAEAFKLSPEEALRLLQQ
jgi:UDP-N-acetylglucosamine 4,6-dehydratase